jgi:hypothetical protein
MQLGADSVQSISALCDTALIITAQCDSGYQKGVQVFTI